MIKRFFILAAVTLCWVSSTPAATFKDDIGRVVTLKGTPKRIIPLAPSLTEILYFLGLGDRVVGVTKFSRFPPEAASKPKIGSYVKLNVEKILSLNPDLVIGTADGNERGVIGLLEQAGIPVFVVYPRDVRAAIKTIDTLGRLCGLPGKGRALSRELNRRIDTVQNRTRLQGSPLVFLQINIKPIMSVNRRTFHHDLIGIAGGTNMTADEPITYPRISLEEVIQRKPDVILISSMQRGGEYLAALRGWQRWKTIPAVQTGRVHLIDSDLIDRPSPRLVDGLEAMARLIHPQVEWED